MEQLQHAQIHFATAAEVLFKQSLLAELQIRPRQSAEGLQEFLVVLDSESAAVSAAHHLVELAEIDSETTNKCFKLVELAMKKQENSGNVANALGEKMWLKEWKSKRGITG